jgi:hypothetical protein
MATDAHDEVGLYFGTSTGQAFASIDEGESCREIASYLPSLTSVEVAVVASTSSSTGTARTSRRRSRTALGSIITAISGG